MTEFQAALLFPFIPVGIYLLMEYLLDKPDDDDDQGGGMMIPAYAPRETHETIHAMILRGASHLFFILYNLDRISCS